MLTVTDWFSTFLGAKATVMGPWFLLVFLNTICLSNRETPDLSPKSFARLMPGFHDLNHFLLNQRIRTCKICFLLYLWFLSLFSHIWRVRDIWLQIVLHRGLKILCLTFHHILPTFSTYDKIQEIAWYLYLRTYVWNHHVSNWATIALEEFADTT